MENISSILESFDINKVAEQSCDDLRRQRGGKLTKKERETLERTIQKFQSSNPDTVLGAIVIYATFYPDDAIQYARQKGVFFYGSAWGHTEHCLEKLNALSELLHISSTQQEYFQHKLSCRWLAPFYQDLEAKLRRDIRRHHKERIKIKRHGVLYESCLIVELLAYISMLFRYRSSSSGMALAVDPSDRAYKSVDDYSNEEISEAVSYLIHIFTEEKGLRPQKGKWMDIDYILSDKVERLILLACQRNMILEWEFQADCLGYALEADEKAIRIYNPGGQLEKGFRIGLIKTAMQEQLSAIQSMEDCPISLRGLAKELFARLGDTVFEWCGEDKLFQRYRMKFPSLLLDPLHPKKDNGALELFQEERMELDFADHELTFRSVDISKLMVTSHCSVVDASSLNGSLCWSTFLDIGCLRKSRMCERYSHLLSRLCRRRSCLRLLSSLLMVEKRRRNCWIS